MTTSPKVERMLPLYEAKMIHHYDHRWATYERDGKVRDATLDEKRDPDFRSLPRYWVRAEVVQERLSDRWGQDWLLGWRDICRATDERTCIASLVGSGASPEGGTLLTLPGDEDIQTAALLLASLNSFVFDFVARQKVGGTHLKYFTMRQLPVPVRKTFDNTLWADGASIGEWVERRVIALVSSAGDIVQAIGSDMTAWNAPRRETTRAELDAAFFHLYGVARDDVDYIMETFPIVKRKDIAEHGEFRTKRLILEVYDKMQAAMDSGTAYQTILDPPPGEGPRHPEQES